MSKKQRDNIASLNHGDRVEATLKNGMQLSGTVAIENDVRVLYLGPFKVSASDVQHCEKIL